MQLACFNARISLVALVAAALVSGSAVHAQVPDDGTEVFVSDVIVSTMEAPGDPDLAVGPNHVVVVSNKGIAVFDKATFVPDAQPSAFWDLNGSQGFWGANTHLVLDPEVMYDVFSDRFWIVAFDGNTLINPMEAFIDFAVSKTANPVTGGWHKYRVDVRSISGDFFDPAVFRIDSPNLAVDSSHMYINMWTQDEIPVDPFVRLLSPLWVFDKTGPLSGGSLDVNFLTMPEPAVGETYDRKGVPALVQKFNAGDVSPQLMLGLDPDYPVKDEPLNHNQWGRLAFHAILFDNVGEPYIESVLVTLPRDFHYISPQNDATQPDAPNLTLTSARFWGTPVQRNGSVWATHHVREVSNGVNVVHWYEFDMNNWPPGGSLTLAPPPTVRYYGGLYADNQFGHTYYPSIGVNSQGEAMVAYNESSNSTGDFISIQRAVIIDGVVTKADIKDDSENNVFFPKDCLPPANCAKVRWGDYSGTESDPTNDCIFWSHQGWALKGEPHRWRTWLARSVPPETCTTFGPGGPESGGRAADLNQDGTVDLLDYLEFQSLFLTRDAQADFSPDGRLDIFDVLAFQTAFASFR